MDRYGLASGTRYTTIADKAFLIALTDADWAIEWASHPMVSRASERQADRQLVESVRRLCRAARDVERQRAFEAGMEKFAAMPLRRYDSEPQPSRWTPGLHTGD